MRRFSAGYKGTNGVDAHVRHMPHWVAVTGLWVALALFYVVPVGAVLNVAKSKLSDAHSRLVLPSVGVGIVNNNTNADGIVGLQQLGVVIRSHFARIGNNRIVDIMPRRNGWPLSLRWRGWSVLGRERLSPRFIFSELYKSSGDDSVGRRFSVIGVMIRPVDLPCRGISVWVREILRTAQPSICKPDIWPFVFPKPFSGVNIGLASRPSSFCDLRGLFCNFFITFIHRAPLQCGDSAIERSSNESTPSSPPYRILYAIVALVSGCLISFRLIVLGKNIIEPDWANFFFLLVAFLGCVYGFYLLLSISLQNSDSISNASQFGEESIANRYESLSNEVHNNAATGLFIKGFTGNALEFFSGSVPVVAESADTKRVSDNISIRNLALYYNVPPALVYLSPVLDSYSSLGIKIINWIFLPTRPHPWRGDVNSGCLRIVRISEVSKVNPDGNTVRRSFSVILNPEVVQAIILHDQTNVEPRSISINHSNGILACSLGIPVGNFGLPLHLSPLLSHVAGLAKHRYNLSDSCKRDNKSEEGNPPIGRRAAFGFAAALLCPLLADHGLRLVDSGRRILGWSLAVFAIGWFSSGILLAWALFFPCTWGWWL